LRQFRGLPSSAHLLFSLTIALGSILALAPAAHANIIIVPTYDNTITSDPNAALIEATINQALAFYEANITNPITVHITYEEMSMGLGQSTTFFGQVSYSQYLAALQSHSSGDAVDNSALATLPGGSTNPVNGNSTVDITTANARALGFSGFNIATDSTIGLNTSITNYAGTTFNPGFYSLLAVVEHETDEALGLGSALDSGTSGPIRPEDLFRFSAPGVRSYTTSSSATSYFSVDGGTTNLIGFNQVGGSSDYGDWVSGSGTAHVQDAFGTPGASPVFGVELTALDAIGYNTPVPEPSSLWTLLLGGIGLLGYRLRSMGV
jgi:hypothetical protein